MKIVTKIFRFLNSFYTYRLLSLKNKWRKIGRNVINQEFAINYYKNSKGLVLNLDNPQTFDEKLWFLKLNKKDELETICSDKYLVRDFVKDLIGEQYLIPLVGVYNDAREVDFSSLPEKCFFKCNHTSGNNMIYDKNLPFNKKYFVKYFNFMLKQNYYYCSGEWNYKNIKPLLIAENVIYDENGNLPLDYKFFCFGGKVKYLFYYQNVCDSNGNHSESENRTLDIFDENMNPVDCSGNFRGSNQKLNLTNEVFCEMKTIAEKLSSRFEFARVDLYFVKSRIYFGEITFYPAGGCNNFKPFSWQYKLGQLIDLSNYGIKNENE